MTPAQKARLERDFMRHINRGQVRYLRAGHLDVIERDRLGAGFTDPLSGRRLIDAFSSAGSFNVGRLNPEVLAALDQALDTLDMGSHGLVSRPKLELAQLLAGIAPPGLTRVHFAAGGGDAVDCALKLARGATGRTGIVSTVKAYHGHTGLALSANGKPHYRAYCEPLSPGFRFVPFNDLEAMEQVVDRETAAVIVEPVQGEAGIFVGTPDYLEGLRQLCDRQGALLIFDEIQTGFCRTGRMFACQHSGVVPDIMTVAKSLGGGLYPNAAVLYRDVPTLTDFVDEDPWFHRTVGGGSDLGCRVSLAVIRYLQQNRVWENATTQGARLRQALDDLRLQNPRIIREVRGIGLMLGIEYLHEFMGPMMSDALARHGVFAAYSGNAPQVMRFMVPVTIGDDDMDRLIASIGAAVADMKRILPIALPAARIPGVLKLINDERVQTALFGALRRFEDLAGAFKGGRS
jgi:acetylornithine/succinyldiaminopimelate/putrescine aminotransferase